MLSQFISQAPTQFALLNKLDVGASSHLNNQISIKSSMKVKPLNNKLSLKNKNSI